MGWQTNVFNQIIIEGDNSGVFMYKGKPGPGTLIGSWASVAGTDPYGNPYPEGLTVGTPATTQISLNNESDGSGQMSFVIPGFFDGGVFSGTELNFAFTTIFGPSNEAAGENDFVEVNLFSSDGTSYANMEMDWVDPSGNIHNYATIDGTGFSANVCAILNGVLPGTGTSKTNPAQPEPWHLMNLDSGWSSTRGVWYRKTADNMVQVFGAATHAAFTAGVNLNGSGALPTGYRPSNTWNIGGTGIPGRAGGEMTPVGVLIAEANGASCTEVDLAGEYPLNL